MPNPSESITLETQPMTTIFPTVGQYHRDSESGCLAFKRATISVQKLFCCKYNTDVEVERRQHFIKKNGCGIAWGKGIVYFPS